MLISVAQIAPEPSKKKKHLNEAELALRREETARKRKHLSEKKLEDEKVRFLGAIFLTADVKRRHSPVALLVRHSRAISEDLCIILRDATFIWF